jgi:hypothetical protein
VIIIKNLAMANPISMHSVNHAHLVKKHLQEAFLSGGRSWNPDIDGYAIYFDSNDVDEMYPCGENEYEWLDPTIWESVAFVGNRIYAIYVPTNNGACNIAYVPCDLWVPKGLRAMLEAFLHA